MILTKEKSEKNAAEFAEEIDAMGQESETGAVKWVKEVEDREQQVREKKEADELTILSQKRKYQKNPYYESLYTLAKRRISEYDIPRGYAVDIILKEDGRLVFGLQKVGFRWYAKGMKICGDPHFDINCVDRMIVQLMLSLDELQRQHEKHRTNSGIILPPRI